MFAIEKTKNSAAGVPVLLGFTFFMGLMLSRLIAMVLGFKNGPELIMTAFGGTAGVFFVMASLATVIKRDLSGMGKWLFVGAMVLMVGAVAAGDLGCLADDDATGGIHRVDAVLAALPELVPGDAEKESAGDGERAGEGVGVGGDGGIVAEHRPDVDEHGPPRDERHGVALPRQPPTRHRL